MHVQGTFSFLNLVLEKNKILIRGRIITLGNANRLNVSSCFHQVGLLVSHFYSDLCRNQNMINKGQRIKNHCLFVNADM